MQQENEKNNMFWGGCTALETWENAWGRDIHETGFAQKRIKSAKSAKLTPVKIDTEDLYGYFQGSHGRYETFLDYCPCGDFIRYRVPCKHIYRLAMELGVMEGKTETDINAIPTPMPRKERIPLDEQIDVVESLSIDAQYSLLHIARNIKSTMPTLEVYLNENIRELIDRGIVAEAKDSERKIKFGKKAEITELLERENIPYKKSDKVNVLKQICIEQIKDKTRETFGEFVNVIICPQYSPQQIHYYLHRKYDVESYFEMNDENIEVYEVSLLETELPDDSVTEQLIKRGYYTRK